MASRPHLLLTGATGFIGTYILSEALEQGWRVTAAVRCESRRDALEGKGVALLELDYSDVSQMTRQLASVAPPDYVVHNAGLTKSLDRRDFMEVNAALTERLLRAILAQEWRPARFLLMSTMGTYSPSGSEEPLRATSPQDPVTAYGRSKLRAERLVEESGLTYTILCPTGVYGRGERDYRVTIDMMRRGVSFLSGLTPQRLSFVHVRDVARAVCFLLPEPLAEGHHYLLSDGRDYVDTDFSRAVEQVLGRRVRDLRVPTGLIWLACQLGELVGHLRGRPLVLNRDKYPILAQHNWLCDCSPLLELGFSPMYDLYSGMREALAADGAPSAS